ncbi:MAG: DUF1501 domain-containing protein [Planctomycetota bacterium]|jgi:uncharacterized protein (DUF1501 family)
MARRYHNPNGTCDGILRRDLLKVGSLAPLGFGLTDFFGSAANAAGKRLTPPNCILIWLDGGPSHLETFDLKPDAPAEVRGPFMPIKTNVPGIHISEWMPQTAKVMDKIALIRSMHSTLGEHNFASHYMLTGYLPTPVLQYPSLGAVVTHARGADTTVPPYITLGNPKQQDMEGGYLPASADPFLIATDPAKPGFAVRDLNLYPNMTPDRLDRRREFRAALDAFQRGVETSPEGAADPAFERAYRLVTSKQAKEAFDLSKEDPATRKLYGRHTLGQQCLMARRLIESGAGFVSIVDRGWDTHVDLNLRLKEGFTGGTAGKIPKLDTAYAGLITDLHRRGMLDDTLVILMGEFGRTPKLNTAGGRDHWPQAYSVALAGGGIPGGQVVGRSDSRGERPAERPVSPADLVRTIYHTLGVDLNKDFHTTDGRPIQINRHGTLINELLT